MNAVIKIIHLHNFGQFHLHLVPLRRLHDALCVDKEEHPVNYRKRKEYVPEKLSIVALGVKIKHWCPLLKAPSKDLEIDGGDLSTGTSVLPFRGRGESFRLPSVLHFHPLSLSKKGFLYNYVSLYECSDKIIHLHNFGQFHLHLVPCRRLHDALCVDKAVYHRRTPNEL